MASYGGETPVNVLSLTSIGTTGVKYTVPSGKYAKLSVLLKTTYAGTGGRATFSIGGVSLAGPETATSAGATPEDWWLAEGQNIQYTSGGGTTINSYLIVILEYNNPV